MFEEMTVAKMYNLNETIAKDIFEGVTYPWEVDRKSTRLNSSHSQQSRMPSSA